MSAEQNSSGAGGKRSFFRRKKSCPFTGPNAPAIDWKDVKILGRYLSERGKIMPSRITAVSQKNQREMAIAVKRARFMALLPYVRTENESRPFRPSGDRPDRGERFDRSDRPERSERYERPARSE